MDYQQDGEGKRYKDRTQLVFPFIAFPRGDQGRELNEEEFKSYHIGTQNGALQKGGLGRVIYHFSLFIDIFFFKAKRKEFKKRFFN